jgi:hypothetical protein
MHLSLKGSMDRQPLTDRLGDRLLAEYGGAAAAYSLRALNGNGDSVVRVRRASDNDEKDFTAEQIELGEMVNWVNSQTVPPLDIGVETSGGRIPVPEGGTSIGIPAAAYSLRNLSTTYTGNVVDVRRSSDNAVASFTASQISNGQMLDFVGGDNTIIQSEDFTSGSWNKSSGRVVITSNSITAPDGELTADLATWSTPNNADSLRQDKSFLAQQYTVSIYLKYNSAQWVQMYFGSTGFTGGHANFDLINGVIGGNKVGSSSIEDVGDGWYRCSVTRTASTSGNTAICATVPVSSGLASRFGAEVAGAYYVWGGQMNEGSIKAYTMTTTGVSGNGFVTKWYDQSGNDNHATQGTAASQPKIVNAGSLVSGGIDFDGVDDFLDTGYSSGNASSQSLFTVFKTDLVDSNFRTHLDGRDANDDGIGFGISSSFGFRFHVDTADTLTTANTTEELLTGIYGSSSSSLYQKGTLVASASAPPSISGTSGNYFIGKTFSGGLPLNGKINEIIIYPSDQSANRTAIEANIGETYGITGIPAYDNTVDGFVETWYDQSGNGNDATQSVAASQPKIVSAGVLVSGGLDFDGVNDRLSFDSNVSLSTNDFYFASVISILDGNTVNLAPVGNAAGNRFLISLNYDTDAAQMRPEDGSFLTQPFTRGTPANETLISISNVSNTATLRCDTISAAVFNTTGKSFTLGNMGQRTPSVYSKHSIKELIIYPSDQSANRVAIETNINDHYNIY